MYVYGAVCEICIYREASAYLHILVVEHIDGLRTGSTNGVHVANGRPWVCSKDECSSFVHAGGEHSVEPWRLNRPSSKMSVEKTTSTELTHNLASG